MTVFKAQTSGVGSDRSTNWATINAQSYVQPTSPLLKSENFFKQVTSLYLGS